VEELRAAREGELREGIAHVDEQEMGLRFLFGGTRFHRGRVSSELSSDENRTTINGLTRTAMIPEDSRLNQETRFQRARRAFLEEINNKEHRKEENARFWRMCFNWSGRRFVSFIAITAFCYFFIWLVRQFDDNGGAIPIVLGIILSFYYVDRKRAANGDSK
jgi:hypothetical protein